MSPDVILTVAVLIAVAAVLATVVLALGLGAARKMSDASRGWALYAVLALSFGLVMGFLPVKGEVGGGEIADCGRLLHPDRSNNYGGEDRLSSDVRNFCRRGYERHKWWLIAPGVVALGLGAVAARTSTARSE